MPLPVQPGRPERIDYEYERNGTAALFMFTELLTGWRRASVRERRTSRDWAEEIRQLLREDFPDAEKVILISDQLNTRTVAALYQMFLAAQAGALARRLVIHYTSKHRSGLNGAELELSALSCQCLAQRIPDIETLRREVEAWCVQRNKAQKAIDGQFTTADARIRPQRLYPKSILNRWE